MKPAIVIMAKVPQLGKVKTRLGVSPERALDLYRAFLRDKIEQVKLVKSADPIVAFTPGDAHDAMREIVSDDALLLAQRGADLGQRLANAASDVLERASGVLLVDSDTPTLPVHFLEEGVRALAEGAVVLGPAWDGGYYAIGLCRAERALFEDVPWSTRDVLSRTVAHAKEGGLELRFLPSFYDVDTPKDYAMLVRELEMLPPWTRGFPEHTAHVVGAKRRAPDRQQEWTTLATRPIHANPWMKLTESIALVGKEQLTLYGVVHCGACVGVLPITEDGRVMLVRQFRYVAQEWTWEIPTGGVRDGETIADAALRELAEEAAVTARTLDSIGSFHPSKSIVEEVAHLFIARDLSPATSAHDITENISAATFSCEDAKGMVLHGEIKDSMTIIALLRHFSAVEATR